MSDKAKRLLSLAGFPALILGLAALAFAFRGPLGALFKSPESVRGFVAETGAWSALAFMGLQVLQVVVFVLPGEIVQLAGGYAFGLWAGTGLSVAGILAGSLVNFAAGRFLGRPFVESLFGPEKVERIERATAGGKAAAAFFLLFAIPGIPKDALTYVAGASRLGFGSFLAISTLGRLPGIVGSSYIGSAVFERDYRSAMALAIIASALFLLGLLFRERLHAFLVRLSSRAQEPRGNLWKKRVSEPSTMVMDEPLGPGNDEKSSLSTTKHKSQSLKRSLNEESEA